MREKVETIYPTSSNVFLNLLSKIDEKNKKSYFSPKFVGAIITRYFLGYLYTRIQRRVELNLSRTQVHQYPETSKSNLSLSQPGQIIRQNFTLK